MRVLNKEGVAGLRRIAWEEEQALAEEEAEVARACAEDEAAAAAASEPPPPATLGGIKAEGARVRTVARAQAQEVDDLAKVRCGGERRP
jgi:hypothetical protein